MKSGKEALSDKNDAASEMGRIKLGCRAVQQRERLGHYYLLLAWSLLSKHSQYISLWLGYEGVFVFISIQSVLLCSAKANTAKLREGSSHLALHDKWR